MRHGFFLTSANLAALFSFACSASTGTGPGNDGTGAGSSSNSGAGSSSNSGAGSSSNSGGPTGAGGSFLGGIPQGGSSGSSATDGGTCAALVLQPEAITEDKMIPMDLNCNAAVPEPIAIYIVLDNSGSMDENHKWPDAVDAITMFVQSDPTALGAPWTCVDKDGKSVTPPASLAPPGTGTVSVALQYFHPEGAGRNADECDGVSHRTPAVPMGPLPANAPKIVSSLSSSSPNGNTPTVGALKGGTGYCSDYQAMNPGKKCVVVLVTDGQPNACGLSSNCNNGGGRNGDCVDPNSASILVPIAADAFQMSSVITFTMGMNGVTADGFTLLDAIAVAGGSDCTPGTPGKETCDITSSGSKGFLDALNTIRKTVQVTSNSSQIVMTTTTQHSTLQCEWGIPKPPPGETFHKDLVNVSVSGNGTTQKLGNVPTKADCAAAKGGWYYDNAAAPTRILACPETCTAVQSSTSAKVEVLLGCATEPATVR
jgi:hypothetical protein